MFGLNDTAALIWRAVETVSDFEQLARLTASENSPPLEVTVVKSFCQQLEEVGLIYRAEPEEESVGKPIELPVLQDSSAPEILFQEELRRIGASCAFLPAQNPLCTQIPMV